MIPPRGRAVPVAAKAIPQRTVGYLGVRPGSSGRHRSAGKPAHSQRVCLGRSSRLRLNLIWAREGPLKQFQGAMGEFLRSRGQFSREVFESCGESLRPPGEISQPQGEGPLRLRPTAILHGETGEPQR